MLAQIERAIGVAHVEAVAASSGAAKLGGRMIDRPVVLQAQRTLQRAGR